MERSILITYVSATGTTKMISSKISEELIAAGDKVTLKEMDSVESLMAYDVVLIGAPINGMRWLPKAVAFVEKHRTELKGKKVSVFFVSYLIENGGNFWKKTIRKGVKKVAEPIAPILIGEFGGRVKEEFPKIPRLILGIKNGAKLDATNPEQVKTYSKELLRLL